MIFYVGSHMPGWLAHADRPPLMVSVARLRNRRRWPTASERWTLDSGSFGEVAAHGRHLTTPAEYAELVTRASEEVGCLDWAAPQDLMCEPPIVAKLGLGLDAHLRWTVDNFVDLRGRLGSLVIPVLQGWELSDYVRCAAMYRAVGVELEREATVGIGSVCRRSNTRGAAELVASVAAATGARLHGFGLKTGALARVGSSVVSADSLAWSFAARVTGAQVEGCTHQTCSSCHRYAYRWHGEVVAATASSPTQLSLV